MIREFALGSVFGHDFLADQHGWADVGAGRALERIRFVKVKRGVFRDELDPVEMLAQRKNPVVLERASKMSGGEHTIACLREINELFAQLRLPDKQVHCAVGRVLVQREQAIELLVGADDFRDGLGLFRVFVRSFVCRRGTG